MADQQNFLGKINRVSESYRINYVNIEFPLLKKLSQLAHNKFKSDEMDNILFSDFLIPLRSFLFNVSTSFASYSNILNAKKSEELNQIISKIISIYPEKLEYQKINSLLNEVLNYDGNKVSDYLKEYINHSSQKHAIVTKQEIDSFHKEYLMKLTGVSNIEFHTENSYKRNKNIFDYVFFVGNESFFDYSFNSTPKSIIMFYISYDIYNNDFNDNSMLCHLGVNGFYSTMYKGLTKFNHRISVKDEELFESEISANEELDLPIKLEVPLINNKLVENYVFNLNTKETSSERIEVVPVELTSSRFILLSANDKKYEVLSNNNIFEKKSLKHLKIGDFLVLRNQSESTLIRDVADEMFQSLDIQTFRKRQATLKGHLRKLENKYGLSKMHDILHKKGLSSLTELKLKNLLKDDTFKLQNNNDFFQFLMVIMQNNEEMANKYLKSSRSLSAFHIQAGKKISNEIREAIIKSDLTPLQDQGSQTIKLPQFKGASISIERVVGIGTANYTVPSSQEKKIIYSTNI